MESRSKLVRNRVESWILFVLLIGVITSAIFEHVIGGRPDYAEKFGPSWLAFVAAGIATFVIPPLKFAQLPRVQSVLTWASLLLIIWTANGLPIDLLRAVKLIPLEVDWHGLVTRSFALAAAVLLARRTLKNQPVISAQPEKGPKVPVCLAR